MQHVYIPPQKLPHTSVSFNPHRHPMMTGHPQNTDGNGSPKKFSDLCSTTKNWVNFPQSWTTVQDLPPKSCVDLWHITSTSLRLDFFKLRVIVIMYPLRLWEWKEIMHKKCLPHTTRPSTMYMIYKYQSLCLLLCLKIEKQSLELIATVKEKLGPVGRNNRVEALGSMQETDFKHAELSSDIINSCRKTEPITGGFHSEREDSLFTDATAGTEHQRHDFRMWP